MLFRSIEYMCRAAALVIIEHEHYGVPFTRLENGRIYQRPFGGQSQNFGGDQAARTCPAADRTGHAMLHALYQQNLRAKTYFFDEFFWPFCKGWQVMSTCVETAGNPEDVTKTSINKNFAGE